MIGKSEGRFGSLDRIVLLPLSLALALNVFPGKIVVWIAILGLAFLFVRMRLVRLLSALSLSGLFLFALIKEKIDISATILVLAQVPLVLFFLFKGQPSLTVNPLNEKSVRTFVIWVFSLFLLVSVQYLLGPRTIWSDYLIQYFWIYASYYILTGIIIVRFDVSVDQLVLPSVFFLSLIYPLMDISIIDLPAQVSSLEYGLRSVEGFGAIGHDRIVGQFLVLAALAFVNTEERRRIVPEIVLGVIISLPILWFSYTRQSLMGAFLGLFLILGKLVFKNYLDQSKVVRIILSALVASVILASLYWVNSEIETNVLSRFGQISIVGVQDESNQIRLNLWKFSWEHIQQNFLLGYGLGGFGNLYEHGFGAWPHNWFIESWIEHGLAGLILFFASAFFLIRSFVRSSDRFIVSWMILGMFWFFVIQFSIDIPRNAQIFFFITIAILTASPRFSKNVT